MSVKDNSYGIASLQDKMLDILKCFSAICEEHNLRYWVAGGSCIGVARHQGFIPWDDDLDVFMPRPDYEKLWELFQGKDVAGQYRLCRTSRTANYHHRVMQMIDLDTTFINKRNVDSDLEHGVYIDILPLDARAKSLPGKIRQVFDAIIYSVYNIQIAPEINHGKWISLATNVMLKAISNPDRRYRIWSAAEKRMAKYDWDSADEVLMLSSMLHEIFNPFPREWFDYRYAQFEDMKVRVPSNMESYLKKAYGNYMKLPPKEQREVKHITQFIDLDNSYRQYKGVHYCIDKKTNKAGN